MAKATKRAPAKAAATATAAAPKLLYEVGLAQPGEDIPDGARRTSCPNCGAKHDVIRTDGTGGQAGTWSVPDFMCVAGCGYTAAHLPVN